MTSMEKMQLPELQEITDVQYILEIWSFSIMCPREKLICDDRYEDEWVTNECIIRIIKRDKSEVISSHLIQSPVLGTISTKELSGSVKTLMLMAFDQSGKVFNASVCGDDCENTFIADRLVNLDILWVLEKKILK